MNERGHFAQEAAVGLLRNWKAGLASALLLFFAVALLAATMLMRTGFADLRHYLESQLSMKLMVGAGYAAEDVAAALRKLDAAERVTIATGDEQLKELERFFRDKPRLLAAFDGSLPDAVTLQLKQGTDMAEVAAALSGLEAVEAVIYPQRFAEQAASWLALADVYGIAALLALGTAAFLTVFVAVRLALLQRDKEVRLKLRLGAKPSLVAMQFMLEGLGMGLLGGIPAVAATGWGYGRFTDALQEEIPALFSVMSGAPLLPLLLLSLVGPLLGAAAALTAVQGRIRDV